MLTSSLQKVQALAYDQYASGLNFFCSIAALHIRTGSKLANGYGLPPWFLNSLGQGTFATGC
jgi:hypothetical protein